MMWMTNAETDLEGGGIMSLDTDTLLTIAVILLLWIWGGSQLK